MPLELLPAVDVANGQAVRLVQGEAGSETDYGDPLAAALTWQQQGAEWIHLVDLDAAFGRGSNAGLLARVVGELDVDVEMSGGIRDDESLESALATGCRRVNIGTAALEQPEWCAKVIAEHGDRVAIGLDVRGTTLAARGWTQDGGMPMGELGLYRFIQNEGTTIGAVMPLMPGAPASLWTYYIGVDDIDRAAEAVRTGGGSVLQGSDEIPGGEFSLNGMDPQGAPFGLVGPRKG